MQGKCRVARASAARLLYVRRELVVRVVALLNNFLEQQLVARDALHGHYEVRSYVLKFPLAAAAAAAVLFAVVLPRPALVQQLVKLLALPKSRWFWRA